MCRNPITSKHGEKQMEEETGNECLINPEPQATEQPTNPQPTTQPNPEPKNEATDFQEQEEQEMSESDLSKMSQEELQSKIKYCEWGLEQFEEQRLDRKGGFLNMLKSILLSIKNYNFCGTPQIQLFMFESEEGLRHKLEQYKAELKRRE